MHIKALFLCKTLQKHKNMIPFKNRILMDLGQKLHAIIQEIATYCVSKWITIIEELQKHSSNINN